MRKTHSTSLQTRTKDGSRPPSCHVLRGGQTRVWCQSPCLKRQPDQGVVLWPRSTCIPSLKRRCGVAGRGWGTLVQSVAMAPEQSVMTDCLGETSSIHSRDQRKDPKVGSLSLHQEIFPSQGLNPGLPHCRWIIYQLSHKGRPRILEWVAYPFSSGSSDPAIEPGSPALQADSLPTEPAGNPQN